MDNISHITLHIVEFAEDAARVTPDGRQILWNRLRWVGDRDAGMEGRILAIACKQCLRFDFIYSGWTRARGEPYAFEPLTLAPNLDAA